MKELLPVLVNTLILLKFFVSIYPCRDIVIPFGLLRLSVLPNVMNQLGMELTCDGDTYFMKIDNEDKSNPQRVYKQVVRSLTSKDLDLWKEIKSQERLANLPHSNYCVLSGTPKD